MHKINWKMDRPDPELIERFREFAPATISDAMGRQNSMNHKMKPLWRGARVCGPALTVKSYACDNLMPHKAMHLAQPGDVIVIQANGHLEGALWGDLLSKSAKARGLEGAVMDAAARDSRDVEALGFPVFSTAVLPGGTYKVNPGSINVPVSVAGVAVEPGDLIVGDDDGVVVVPQAMMQEVLEKAEAIAEREKELTRRIEAGEILFDIFQLEELLERPDVEVVGAEEPSGPVVRQ